ncbi:MAG: SAM-dependent methyltransferase [Steroidobacteraceae bacterium]|nr:SAM-dependent methyltransferase [Steroidobacteraceae bacterium]
MSPLLTLGVHEALLAAARAGGGAVECSLDLRRSNTVVEVEATGWRWQGSRYPYLETCRDRTIYHWTGAGFEPVSRYSGALIKLVPTEWGPPTFEIDGIKMLPTAQVSPWDDAGEKVALVAPRGKAILDTCGGLGYFAAWCLAGGAASVLSLEKNPDVLWLRSLNPWSPRPGGALTLEQVDGTERVATLPAASVDAILHDPPRFGIAGELYSQAFYGELARVLQPGGRLFHYVGAPNRLTSGRDVPAEVARRLRHAGFDTASRGDGILATRRRAKRGH